jgi:carbonic anhydrase
MGVLLTLALCGSAQRAPADESRPRASSHWGYGADDGPSHWADLRADFALCRDGREQSPIDLRDAKATQRPRIRKEYAPASLRVIHHEHLVDVFNNGHTVQVNYDEGSDLQIGEHSYSLVQYHFHSPSEHTVDGQRFPMEMHLVHRGPDEAVAVIGVLIREGRHNPAFDPVWSRLPSRKGQEEHFEHVRVDVDDLLPEDDAAYRYRGSLTTPPCNEGVSWFVGVTPIELSAEQIAAFREIVHDNARPVQPLGARSIAIDQSAP